MNMAHIQHSVRRQSWLHSCQKFAKFAASTIMLQCPGERQILSVLYATHHSAGILCQAWYK